MSDRPARVVNALMSSDLKTPRLTFSPYCQWCFEPRIAIKRNLLVCQTCDRPRAD